LLWLKTSSPLFAFVARSFMENSSEHFFLFVHAPVFLFLFSPMPADFSLKGGGEDLLLPHVGILFWMM